MKSDCVTIAYVFNQQHGIFHYQTKYLYRLFYILTNIVLYNAVIKIPEQQHLSSLPLFMKDMRKLLMY